jgi:DNA polymerase-3 subunit delta'
VISIPGQPLAERILRAALADARAPQQLLFFGPPDTGKRAAALEVAWGLMDPAGAHQRTPKALDLIEVEATGQQIMLADIDEALGRLASRPNVLSRRVMIVHGAERLDEDSGAPRLLKILEEPPPRSSIILVTDSPVDLLDTLRSRCLPVPFRSLGWRAARERLTPFEAQMRAIGVDFGLAALTGDGAPGERVAQIQARMEETAGEHPSDVLVRLRAEAAGLAGKRGERTATKRAEDQEKRERRRMVTDGWTLVLDAAAETAGDALALSVGAKRAVRLTERLEDLRPVSTPERQEFLERAIEEIQLARSELVLNPKVELAAEALLIRIENARRGHPGRLIAHGRAGY